MNVDLHPASLNFISLCTGGAGLDLGLELAIPGARSVCYVEREAFACATLVEAMEERRLAQAPIWTDASSFDGRPWRGVVDCLIGGIPCQPHSLAGRRRGQHDERDLWSAARRIIAQARPWVVLIENVAGMLSAGDDQIAGAERVRRDLRRLGYAVEGGLFTAAEVGAPHQRERVFILGVADAGRIRFERWGTAGDIPGAPGRGEGQGYQRQWHGHAAGDGCEDLADAGCTRSHATALAGICGGEESPRSWHGQSERRGVGQADTSGAGSQVGLCEPGVHGQECEAVERIRGPVGYATGDGRREGWPEPDLSQRDGPPLAITGLSVADADIIELRRIPSARELAQLQQDDGLGLFPPGPGDAAAWRDVIERAPHLVPAVRRVADGLASRIDRLRMLGNGVVPLEAAYAVRTLATRLATAGSPGATRLVRMMGEAP